MKLLKNQKIFFISGAGISKPSDIDTFMGKNSIWNKFNLDMVSNFNTWFENYEKVHEFYNFRRVLLADKKPNKAHEIINILQKRFGKDRIINITTNTDNLFNILGVNETIEVHGNICNIKNILSQEIFSVNYKPFNYNSYKEKIFKPDVVFYNEKVEKYKLLDRLLNGNFSIVNHGDIFIFIGISFESTFIDRFLPNNKIVHTININPDNKTNFEYDFNESYNYCATKALEDIFCAIL